MYSEEEAKVKKLNFPHPLTYLEHFDKERNGVTKVLKYCDGVCTKKRTQGSLTNHFTKFIMQKNYHQSPKNQWVFKKNKM